CRPELPLSPCVPSIPRRRACRSAHAPLSRTATRRTPAYYMPADAIELRTIATRVARGLRVRRHPHRLEPLRSAINDVRHAGDSLDIVHHRRLAKRSLDRGKRRLGAGPGALALEAFDQPRLLAADIGPRAAVLEHIEVDSFA